jgi:S-DNA-T family DNA segregation ATPase FtsK/SpoIIIE
MLPGMDLLDKHTQKENTQDERKTDLISTELKSVLEEFGVKGEILNASQGPVVTMFEFRPNPGIKTSRVISLSDDIARSMSAISARIATIPGKNAIGIELPNKNRHTVYLKELLFSESFKTFTSGIPLVLGKDIGGTPIMADLAKMPHLLVAGTTGSGKSVSINDMILSILFKFSPKDCKLIMIDPKMLELSVYDEIPHLLTPVVTDPKKAVFALKWAVAEMENRYRMMSKLGVRNIDGFNKKLGESREKGDLLVRKVQTGFDQETGRPLFETQQLEFEPMPYIVIIVDEMADLMLVAGKDVESAIQRLAQMARAAGIHLIMATQRPSVDVITGTIKANFPTRISFQVTSKIDSRTILGEQGAEQLLGQGDMLYMSGAGRILRVHGPFVKDIEVERVVSFIKGQEEPVYVDVVSEQFHDGGATSEDPNASSDSMFQKAVEIILNDKKVSISYLQRKLQIGYNRAARMIEEMEEKGIVSAPNHTGKREILA